MWFGKQLGLLGRGLRPAHLRRNLVLGIGAGMLPVVTSQLLHARSELLVSKTEGAKQQRRKAAVAALEIEYQEEVLPLMTFLEKQSERLGQDYPEALFYDKDLESQVSEIAQDLMNFWQKVRRMYNSKLIPRVGGPERFWRACIGDLKNEDDFFNGHWVDYAHQYRTLVEPVDSFIWYFKGKNTADQELGHYVDDQESSDKEISLHSSKRSSVYQLLQERERFVTQLMTTKHGADPQVVQSSLSKARMYKEMMGTDRLPRKWKDFKDRKASLLEDFFHRSHMS